MKSTIRITVMTVLITASLALAQAPVGRQQPPVPVTKPEPPATPAPPLTAAESEALTSLQGDYNDLEKQRQEIVTKQQAVGAKYQKFAEAIAKEHPGFMLGPNGNLVEQPKPKDEPKK